MVWVGTNNHLSGNYDFKNDASVLACFRESDGKLLYTFVSPRMKRARHLDWPYSSIASSPLISGDKLWFVTNRWETVCLDIGPLKRNAGDPVVVWKSDMMKELGVHPYGATMHYTRFASIASHGDRIYVITGNGIDPTSIVTLPGGKAPTVPAPEAPRPWYVISRTCAIPTGRERGVPGTEGSALTQHERLLILRVLRILAATEKRFGRSGGVGHDKS